MPRPYSIPEPHPPLTTASLDSRVEIEQRAGGAFAYALNDGPWLLVPPARPDELASALRKVLGNPYALAPENMLKPSGRGIFLINGLMDDVQYADGGRELQMKKRKA